MERRTLAVIDHNVFPIEAQMAAMMADLGGGSLNGAVERARALIPSMIAQLALVAYSDGTPARPRSPIIDRPDPFATRYTWLHETVASLVDHGNAYWRLSVAIDGHPTVAQVLNPSEVAVTWNDNRTRREYVWRGVELTAGRDIAHIRLSPRAGVLLGETWVTSPALRQVLAADAYAMAVFGNGGIPPAVLESDQNITATEAAQVRDEWTAARRDNPGAPGVTPFGLKYRPIQWNPAEAQLIEMRRFGVTEVARLAGIPGPLLLAELAGSSLTYQNIAQVSIELARMTLAPLYLAPIEETLADLLPRGWAVRADLDELYRADTPTRWGAYKIGVDGGWITTDEIRQIEGLGGPMPAPAVAPTPARDEMADPLAGAPA